MKTLSNRKNFLLTLFSSSFAMIVPMILNFILIPISIKYWGSAQYGVLAIIANIVVYVSNTNLGLTATATILMNKSSDLIKKRTIFIKTKKLLFLVCGVGVLILLVLYIKDKEFILLFASVPKGITLISSGAMFVTLLFLLLKLPLSLNSSAFTGFHKAYIDNYFKVFVSLSTPISFLVTLYLKQNLLFFACLSGVVSTLILLIENMYLRKSILSKVEMKNGLFQDEETHYSFLMKTGFLCLSGGIANVIVQNTDNVVIGKIMGVQFVTSYSVLFRIFTMSFLIIYMINSSIIPILGKEIGNKNSEAINEIYRGSFLSVLFVGGFVWIGSVAWLKSFVIVWVGSSNFAGYWVLFFLGGYAFLFCIVNLNYIFVNSFNLVKEAQYVVWIEAGINLIFSIILCKYWGLVGIAFGTFLGTLVGPYFLFPKVLKKASRINMKHRTLRQYIVIMLIPYLIVGVCISHYFKNFLSNTGITVILFVVYSIHYYLMILKKENISFIKRIKGKLWKRN